MKKITLLRFEFSPGYGDMLGGYHAAFLMKNNGGKWEYICHDREDHSAPTIVTVYDVDAEAVSFFEQFLTKKRVFSLKRRPKSDLFITDYSPWHMNIDYETTFFGKIVKKSCDLYQYKKYSGRDNKLIKETKERFTALRGEKISETVEDA